MQATTYVNEEVRFRTLLNAGKCRNRQIKHGYSIVSSSGWVIRDFPASFRQSVE